MIENSLFQGALRGAVHDMGFLSWWNVRYRPGLAAALLSRRRIRILTSRQVSLSQGAALHENICEFFDMALAF